MTPIQQLKEQIKHYELSGRAFREDSDRYHKKAEEAFNTADQYKKAVALLESKEPGGE